MYLNYTIDHFLDVILQVSLSDEGNIIRKIFWFALDLSHTFLDINCFFMSSLICLMRSIQVNVLLFCANKPNFGPYNCPKCSLDIIVLISDV